MYRTNNQDHELGDVTGRRSDRHPPTRIPPPHEETNVGDSSGPLFTLYSSIAEEEDNKMTERWQHDAKGFIIFTGLFSTVIAALVVVTLPDLRPNPGDASAFYLERIYQLQVNPNVSHPSVSFEAASASTSSPPNYAVWVNSLWLLSLVINLSCAMLATSLQQWARRYLRITQPKRSNPHKRARTRAFFKNGVEKFHVSWAVDVLPTLVHLSLFIFFAGLLVYLFHINHTVFNVVACWVALSSSVYGFITIMPIIRHDSLYYSPLSSIVGYLHAIIRHIVLKVADTTARYFLPLDAYSRIGDLRNRYRHSIVWGVDMAAGKVAASMTSSEVDGHILEWTVESLEEDDTLEILIASIPGFYKSEVVKAEDIPKSVEMPINLAMRDLLQSTLSSKSVSELVKKHRLAICLNVADVALNSSNTGLLFEFLLSLDWGGMFDSIEIGHYLKSWDKINKGRFTPFIRGIIAHIVSTVLEREARWTALALNHLDVLEVVLESYHTRDSLVLANFIHYIDHANHFDSFSYCVVKSLSKLDIRNTLPEQQRSFCVLWNRIVGEARATQNSRYPVLCLGKLRRHYIALHQGTPSAPSAFSESTASYDDILTQPSSYPLCEVPNHLSRPSPSPSTHNVEEVTITEAARLPTAT